jgi:uncharacterized protein (DUF1697 family)
LIDGRARDRNTLVTAGFAPAPLTKYVAFLRAINVGGRTVKMDALRRSIAISPLGLSDVETFIASGNLIFQGLIQDTRALEQQIEAYLLETLGYTVETFVRTTAEVAAIAAYAPFPDLTESEALYIAFLHDAPDDATRARLLARQDKMNDFHIHGREVYWRIRGTLSTSTLSNAQLERTLAVPVTIRNVTTVRRLAAKYPAG